ncbi:MAG: RCC1 domain-containing protein, partial [Acetanaerobacterium sp.]
MKKAISIVLCVLLTITLSAALLSPPLHAEDPNQIPISQFVADNHVLMTRADGRMLGWGDNTYGQLGLGEDAETSYTKPVEITFFADKGKIRQIAAIKDTSFVLLNNGELYSTGSGTYGKHGQGDTYDKNEWGRVGGNLTFKKLYTNGAAEFALAETYDGSLYAWGKNDDGQLGVGDANARTSPALVMENANVKELWLGETYAEYVDLDGNLYYWGTNAAGQMGLRSAYTKTTYNQTAYSNGNVEKLTSMDDIMVLNPDVAYEPTEFTLIAENEILNWSTTEPDPPAVDQLAFTKLKYNIKPKDYEPNYNVTTGPYFRYTSKSASGSKYKYAFTDLPAFLVNKYRTSKYYNYVYM